MDNELGILISSRINIGKSVQLINDDLKALSKHPSIKTLNLNLGIDTSNFQSEIKKQTDKINKSTKGVKIDADVSEITDDFENVSKFVENLKKQFDATTVSIRKDIDVANNKTKQWIATFKQLDGVTRTLRIEPYGDSFRPKELSINDKQEELALKKAQEAIALANKRQQQADKLFQAEQKTTKELEKRLEYERRMAAIKVQDFRRRYNPVITPEQNKLLDDYVQGVGRLSTTTPDLNHRLKMLSADFHEVSSSIKEAGSRTDTFGAQLKTAMSRIPIWMVGMSAFYFPLRRMQDAIQQIIELDSQMVVLERVSNGVININQAMEDSIGIAERLGNTIAQVNDGLISFARQGYRGNDLTSIAEVATIMGNVSDLEIEDSASALTAAMKGFNIEAQNAIRIVDSLNEVDKFVVPYTSDSILQIA